MADGVHTKAVAVLGFAGLLMVGETVYAGPKYAYTGQTYTEVDGGTCLNPMEHASVSLVLAKRLPRSTQGIMLLPRSWIANTGAHYLKSATPGAAASFTVDTDANRSIVQYQVNISFSKNGGTPIQMNLASSHYSGPGDAVTDGLCRRTAASQAFTQSAGSWLGP